MQKSIFRSKILFLKSARCLLENQLHTITVNKPLVVHEHKIANTFLAVLNSQTKSTFVRCFYSLKNEYYKEIKTYRTSQEITSEIITNICIEDKPFSPEKWDKVKIDIMDQCLNLTDEIYDSVLMSALLQSDKFIVAQSFMNYMEKSKLKTNFVTLCKYIVLCSRHINLVDEDTILQLHDKVASEIDTNSMDSRTAECLIQGLCVTDKWKVSLKYLDNIPKSEWTAGIVNALARAAAKNRDFLLFWKILHQWYKKGTYPENAVCIEFIKCLSEIHDSNVKEADEFLFQFLSYVKSKGFILKERTVYHIEKYFTSHKSQQWSVIHSQVNREGICSTCKQVLEPCSLTHEEFSELRESFLTHSLRKSDVFINTTEEEFRKYCNFVQRFKPFDIVLDGLNVAYADMNGRKKHSIALQLYDVVRHLSLSQEVNRILILGKYHMKKWPSPIMRAIKEKAFIFYVSNISQDDPYLIYAALASGPNTLLMSMDMMRDHIARLPDPETIYLFKKWQQSHQIYMVEGEKGGIVIKGPLKHSINVQGNMKNGWHIPYDNEFKREPYEELNNWLCIQKKLY